MDLYREELLNHFRDPHNFGDLLSPTVSYEEYNPLCGDRIVLQLKLSPSAKSARDSRLVTMVKFRGEGCAISTASASIFTDYIQGKTLEDLGALEGEDILRLLNLENLSPSRLKCALLPLEAFRHAVKKIESGKEGA